MSTDAVSLRLLVTGATGYVGSRLIPALLTTATPSWPRHAARVLSTSTRGARTWRRGRSTSRTTTWSRTPSSASTRWSTSCTRWSPTTSSPRTARPPSGSPRPASARSPAPRLPLGAGAPGRAVRPSALAPEVEQVFLGLRRAGDVLRAAMVIGAGSTSYELLRRLTERVPVVHPGPVVDARSLQPIAVEDVVLLVGCALRGHRNRHYDVGGEEVLTYPDLLATFAEVAGLSRRHSGAVGAPLGRRARLRPDQWDAASARSPRSWRASPRDGLSRGRRPPRPPRGRLPLDRRHRGAAPLARPGAPPAPRPRRRPAPAATDPG